VGRIDFALFPAAGYLCYGRPDTNVLAFSLFIYPWTLAHLGVNDLVDIENDRARGLKSVAILYGIPGVIAWIGLFSALHFLAAPLFWGGLGTAARLGFVGGFVLLGLGNYKIVREQRPQAGLAALPLFHLSMAVYVSSIVLDYVL
jgi:4-hydroxybenzoate polyprenyltransferase